MGSFFLTFGKTFIKKKRKLIEEKAIRDDFIKSIFIPTLSRSPITLRGMPYLMRGNDIFSEALGFILPKKKPININGIMFINNLVIVLNMFS